jgi:hypothetical protein
LEEFSGLRSGALRQFEVFAKGGLWLGCGFSLGGFALVLQSSSFDGVALDPFTLKQDGLAASEVDIGRGQVLQAFVVAVVIVMVDEAIDVRSEVARQIIVLRMRF